MKARPLASSKKHEVCTFEMNGPVRLTIFSISTLLGVSKVVLNTMIVNDSEKSSVFTDQISK